ncbi:unnamed protein product [Ilex paraguariensis]|uniref:Tubby-like F-box protein 3 n=1 Tax=Ilex paraguariensis TaxID=185542 RepID=A0ABC8UBI2_9AQUA
MSFKVDFGGISRRGFEMKLNYGLGSRSRRVIQDTWVVAAEAEMDDGLSRSCWANMPSELLREVLVRIEASESSWPLRKSVVACAGVCRSWREIVKEIVRTPEGSGKLTFPVSVKQPGPRDSLLQCYIKRNRATQTYHLYLSESQALADDGKFLLAAHKCRRPTHTDYTISLNAGVQFFGTKFTVCDGLPPHAGAKMTKSRSTRLVGSKQVSPRVPAGNYPVAHISYELNVLGSRGPRRMHCVMDAIPVSAIEPGGVAPTQIEFPLSNIDSFPTLPFFRSRSNRMEKILSSPLDGHRDRPLVLENKAPRWHEQLQCWCLNFHGRVTVASVKNFQLVASLENGQARSEHEKVILQFGKVGKDVFTMDYRYPISAFQAFAICLSSFDTKIARE